MKVGDIVEFNNTGYLGVVLGFTNFDGVRIFITDEEFTCQKHVKNPTVMSSGALKVHAKVISCEADTQSASR